MSAATSYAELREMDVEELVRRYDGLAQHTQLGVAFYREEIARRDSAMETEKIIAMTRHMRNLTVLITVLTLMNVTLVALTLAG